MRRDKGLAGEQWGDGAKEAFLPRSEAQHTRGGREAGGAARPPLGPVGQCALFLLFCLTMNTLCTDRKCKTVRHSTACESKKPEMPSCPVVNEWLESWL